MCVCVCVCVYAVLKRLATPSDFHISLPSVVPFAHSSSSFTHSCIYPIFPSSSGTASFFPSFRFPVNHNFGNRVGSILSTCPHQMSCFRVISSNIVSGASIFSLIYSFVFLSSLEILVDRLNASISVAMINIEIYLKKNVWEVVDRIDLAQDKDE